MTAIEVAKEADNIDIVDLLRQLSYKTTWLLCYNMDTKVYYINDLFLLPRSSLGYKYINIHIIMYWNVLFTF